MSSPSEEPVNRKQLATFRDVYRIQKSIEEETIHLAGGDGSSVVAWAEKPKAEGHFMSLKTSSSAPPPGSNLAGEIFVLIIQTKYQQECWCKHGHRFAGLDATHNTTHYENMSLFTLLICDKWGHGMSNTFLIEEYHRLNFMSRNACCLDDFFQCTGRDN